MPKRILFFFCISFLLGKLASAQSTLSAETIKDTVQLKQALGLAEKYRWTIPDSGIYYGRMAIAGNEKIKASPRFTAFAWNSIGYASYMKGEYPVSIQAFQQYYNFSKKADDRINMAFALNNEGNIYIEQGDYSSALDKYKQALEIRQQAGDSAGIAMSFNNIGFIYKDIGDYEKALNNFFFSLREYERLGDQKALAKTLNFISIVYGKMKEYKKALSHLEKAISLQLATKDSNELAISYQTRASLLIDQGLKDQAIADLRLAMNIYEKRQDSRQIALIDNDLGKIFLENNKPDSAAGSFEDAIRLNRTIGNIRNQAISWLGLARARTMMGQHSAAGIALDSAAKSIEATGRKDDLKQYYAIAAEHYAATRQYELAYDFQKKFSTINDTLLNEQNLKSMADMEVKYETEKKEQEIRLQQAEISRKNIILISALILFALLLLLALSGYRRYRLRQQAKLQQAIITQQEMATKAVIEAEENERQRIARDLHDGVGQMMSAARMNLSAFEEEIDFKGAEQALSFEKIIGLVDESCREIRSVSHNMMPNALLKNSLASAIRDFIDKMDKKTIQVQVYIEGLDERLDMNIETVLYRVIQECVNNVIKHSAANTLDISVIRDADGISATIEDNGKGFDTAKRENFEGIGLRNIMTRVEYLKGTVEFDSLPGRGTLVAIHVPI